MDDTFTLKKRKVMAICDEILKRNIEIMWGCTSRVDTLDEKTSEKNERSRLHYNIYRSGISRPTTTGQYVQKTLQLQKLKMHLKLHIS